MRTRSAASASADPDQNTVSSELLYYMLTRMTVYGVPPVGTDEFTTNEVRDTDGDGLVEFVDAWGVPLRFYRWPTRLIRPALPTDYSLPGNVNRNVADLLIKGLPGPPPSSSGQRDALTEDPDDRLGLLKREIDRLLANNIDVTAMVNEQNWHTLDTYHVPLIVSMGPDGMLGLLEPYDATNFGTLAQPIDITAIDALTDNITNLNRRAGGN